MQNQELSRFNEMSVSHMAIMDPQSLIHIVDVNVSTASRGQELLPTSIIYAKTNTGPRLTQGQD